MCGRYVITNPVSKTKKIVKTAIKVDDLENYNAHPYQQNSFLRLINHKFQEI